MKTLKKKLFALLMAVAMLASLAVPALANNNTPPEGAVDKALEYASSTNIPTVTVTMPTSPKVILNPYRMTVTVSVTSGDTTVSGDFVDQIVSPILYIKNETLSPMKVGVNAIATVGGQAVLSAKPCTGKETTLSAFLIAELMQTPVKADPETWFTDVSNATTINEKCYPQIIPTASPGKTAPAILSVDKATKSGGVVTPNYIATKVTGNLAGNPTGGWTSSDKVDLKLVYTFTPGVANSVDVSGATNVTPSKTESVMGATVRLTSTDKKQPVVKDAAGTAVTVTKVTDELYYFVMPASEVTVTV